MTAPGAPYAVLISGTVTALGFLLLPVSGAWVLRALEHLAAPRVPRRTLRLVTTTGPEIYRRIYRRLLAALEAMPAPRRRRPAPVPLTVRMSDLVHGTAMAVPPPGWAPGAFPGVTAQ